MNVDSNGKYDLLQLGTPTQALSENLLQSALECERTGTLERFWRDDNGEPYVARTLHRPHALIVLASQLTDRVNLLEQGVAEGSYTIEECAAGIEHWIAAFVRAVQIYRQSSDEDLGPLPDPGGRSAATFARVVADWSEAWGVRRSAHRVNCIDLDFVLDLPGSRLVGRRDGDGPAPWLDLRPSEVLTIQRLLTSETPLTHQAIRAMEGCSYHGLIKELKERFQSAFGENQVLIDQLPRGGMRLRPRIAVFHGRGERFSPESAE